MTESGLKTTSFSQGVIEFVRLVLPPILIILFGVIGFFVLAGLKTPPEKTALLAKAFPLVYIDAVKPENEGVNIVVDGVVVPFRGINIAAEVGGRIVQKSEKCRAGYYVAKGEELVEIEPTNYLLDLKRFEKEIGSAANSLEENDVESQNLQKLVSLAQEELELQLKDIERMRTLFATNTISSGEFEQSRKSLLGVQSALAQLENQLLLCNQRRNNLETTRERAEIQYERAKVDLARTKIVAPVEGMIAEDCVETDSYVNVGQRLLTLIDTTKVEIRCNIKIDDIYWLWMQMQQQGDGTLDPTELARSDYQIPQTAVTISYQFSDQQQFEWTGVLKRYDGAGFDVATRTVPCRIEVPNPRDVRFVAKAVSLPEELSVLGDLNISAKHVNGPPTLFPGMFVSVIIHARPDMKLLSVPEIAVQPGGTVLKLQDGNKIDIVKVIIVKRFDGRAILKSISGNLQEDDAIVVSPISYVEQGMQVRLTPD